MSVYGVVGVISVASQVRPITCRASPVATSGLPPHRSAKHADHGASSIGMPVHGSTRSPAARGE